MFTWWDNKPLESGQSISVKNWLSLRWQEVDVDQPLAMNYAFEDFSSFLRPISEKYFESYFWVDVES